MTEKKDDLDSKEISIGYQQNNNQNQHDPQYINYLEHEYLRLEKLKEFITVKIPIKKQYSQTLMLIAQEKRRREYFKGQLLEKLSNPNSIFQKNMETIFDRLFVEVKK